MKIIRNFLGAWPQWHATLDDGTKVFIYIRYGEVRVGVGDTVESASNAAEEVAAGAEFAGVTDAVDALVQLRKRGFYYVAPVKD